MVRIKLTEAFLAIGGLRFFVQRDLASVYKEKRERQRHAASRTISHGATVRRVDGFFQESNLHHFKVYSDEHEEPWGGTNKAPSPLGFLLSAIAFSINNQILIQSAVSGVRFDSLETRVTAWFDPDGCLDIKGHDPALTRVALEFDVGSPSSIEAVRRVVRKAARCDPTYSTLRKAARIEMRVRRAGASGAGRSPHEGGHHH